MSVAGQTKKDKQVPPRAEFEEAAADIQAAIRTGATALPLRDDLLMAINRLMAVKVEHPGSENLVLEVLAPVLVEDNHSGAGFMATVCGEHIRGGADPNLIAPALIEGYKKALRPSKEFVFACRAGTLPAEVLAKLEDEGGGCDAGEVDRKRIECLGGPLLQGNPEWANAWESLEFFGMAANTVFRRSAKARALGAADVELQELLAFHKYIAPNAIHSYGLTSKRNG